MKRTRISVTLAGLLALGLTAWMAGCSTPTPRSSSTTAAPAAKSSTAFVFGTGAWLADRVGDVCTLSLRGGPDDAAVRQARQAMDWVAQAGCTRKLLEVNGPHGVVNEAITLGAMARNRGYETVLPAGAICATPCLLVFAAGTSRWLPAHPASAQLVWSQIPPDQDFGRQTCETVWSRGQQQTLQRYLGAMLPEATARRSVTTLQAATCQRDTREGPDEALASGLATGRLNR